MCGHATNGVPRQKGKAPGVPAPRSTEDERDDAKDEPDGVQKPVGHPHPPRAATQVAPVGEPGNGGCERSQRTENERGVGRMSYGLLPRSNIESIEDERRGPGSHRHVRECRVQRRLEPDSVERVTRRGAARIDSLLHLRLNAIGDVVQKGQCFDHTLHKGLCHLFHLSSGNRYSMPRFPGRIVTTILASLQQARAETCLRVPSLRPGGRASVRSGCRDRASSPGTPRPCPYRSRSGATVPGWPPTRAAKKPSPPCLAPEAAKCRGQATPDSCARRWARRGARPQPAPTTPPRGRALLSWR